MKNSSGFFILRFILITYLILQDFNCFSQTFQKTIQSGPSLSCRIDNLFQISDQSYYIPETHAYTANCASSGNYVNSWVTHLDINGNITPVILWPFQFNYDNNKVVRCNTAIIIIQDDITGDTLVNRILPAPYWHFFTRPTIDNYLIAYTPTPSTNSTDTIEKYDSLANRIFKRAFTKDTDNIAFDYYPATDSGIYQVREFKSYPGWVVYKRQIVKYNSSLDSLWFKNLDPGGKIYQTPEHHFILIKQDSTCQKQITTFDDNLDTLTFISFNDSTYWSIMLPVKGGGIVSSSYKLPNDSGTCAFGKIDPLGNTLWRRQMHPFDTSYLHVTKIIQTRDEGYLLGGYHDVVATDSMHCFIPNTASVVMKIDSMGILTAVYEHRNENYSVAIYPNPANNELYVNPSFTSNENVSISIIDILGKTIREDKITLNGEREINIKELPEGLYFLQIAGKKIYFVGRFVKS